MFLHGNCYRWVKIKNQKKICVLIPSIWITSKLVSVLFVCTNNKSCFFASEHSHSEWISCFPCMYVPSNFVHTFCWCFHFFWTVIWIVLFNINAERFFHLLDFIFHINIEPLHKKQHKSNLYLKMKRNTIPTEILIGFN